MDDYILEQIISSCSIVDYLSENGINPVRKSGDKWVYRCPIHAGDNDPSFVVYPSGYKGRSFQSYHCFGCKSGINIINLISDLEKIPIKKAFIRVANDADISDIDVLEHCEQILPNIEKFNVRLEDTVKSRDVLFLNIVLEIREHLSLLKYLKCDEFEREFFEEKVYPYLDSVSRKKDIEGMKRILNFLREKGFPGRVSKNLSYKEKILYNNPWGRICQK